MRLRGALVLVTVSVLVGAGCWSTTGANPGRTYNPVELTINASNVSGLVEDWSAGYGGGPIVTDGVTLYAGSGYSLGGTPAIQVFDLGGGPGCSGTPRRCPSLWSASLPGGQITEGLTVADGVLFATSDANVFAFDAAGIRQCSGTPKVCSPLWISAPRQSTTWLGDLAVVEGTVLVTTDRLLAYDASGASGCAGSPRVCSPKWTSSTGYTGTPAVFGDTVYVSPPGGGVAAFDRAGAAGCSGTPKVCSPRWTAPYAAGGPIAVADGVVYLGQEDSGPLGATATHLVAFDAAGQSGCSGVPRQCAPLWVAPLGTRGPGGGGVSNPSVGNGTVFIAGPGGVVQAFDAAGQSGCSGLPKVCTPLWTTTTNRVFEHSGSVIANGLLYAGPDVYDANGVQGCSGTPKTCRPIAGLPLAPFIANGHAITVSATYRPAPQFTLHVYRPA